MPTMALPCTLSLPSSLSILSLLPSHGNLAPTRFGDQRLQALDEKNPTTTQDMHVSYP
jgi:hypothetical protein